MKRLSIIFVMISTMNLMAEKKSSEGSGSIITNRVWIATDGKQVNGKLSYYAADGLVTIIGNGNKYQIKEEKLSDKDKEYLSLVRDPYGENLKKVRDREFLALEQELFNTVEKDGKKGEIDISVKEFHATKPPIAIFRVKAELSDNFNFEFNNREQDLWSVVLYESANRELIGWGYILKKDKGNDLFEILRDGKPHSLLITIGYGDKPKSSSHFLLYNFREYKTENKIETNLE